MSSILSCTNFCPNYADVPRNLEPGHPNPHPSWKITTVHKTAEGRFVTNDKGGFKFDYMEEVATGDFYQMDDTERLGGVAGGILLFAPIYCGLIMTANAICIVLDIVGISIEAFKELANDWKKRTKSEAFGNFFLRIIVEIPTSILQDIWGIARAPFYTAAMMVIAVYGLYNPLGARPWYNKIESKWHDGKGYEYDIRHHQKEDFNVKPFWQSYREGKILFMVYCCMQCGNRNNPRFTFPERRIG